MSAHALREAVPADVPRLTEIYAHAVLNGTASYELVPPTEAEMLARFESLTGQDYPYIVAVDGRGKVVGCCACSSFATKRVFGR